MFAYGSETFLSPHNFHTATLTTQPEFASLKDVAIGLYEQRRALPPQHQHLRVHQHFGLTLDTFEKLPAKARIIRLASCFYDTDDFALAKRNWWLIFQEVWTLKKCERESSDENFVIFHAERDREKIEAEVANALQTPSKELTQLCPNRYAIIRTERHSYTSGAGWSLYVDSAQLATDDFYLVGTLSLAAEGNSLSAQEWPLLEDLDVFKPVRSRVAEFISCHKRDLFEALVGKVLPECGFYSSPGLNHHPTRDVEHAAARKSPPPAVIAEDEDEDAAAEQSQWDDGEVDKWNTSVAHTAC